MWRIRKDMTVRRKRSIINSEDRTRKSSSVLT